MFQAMKRPSREDAMPGRPQRVGMKSGTQRPQKALRASQRAQRKAGAWREAFPAFRALDRVRSRILGGSPGRPSRTAPGSRPESGRPDARVGRAPSVFSVGLCALCVSAFSAGCGMRQLLCCCVYLRSSLFITGLFFSCFEFSELLDIPGPVRPHSTLGNASAVPPTTSAGHRIVGSASLTGTPWPSLPQVPISKWDRSLPMRVI